MAADPSPRARRGVPSKRQRWQAGAVVEIPLDEGAWAYGQLGDPFVVAVFDGVFDDRPTPQDVSQRPILFKTFVHRDTISKGYWLKVGQIAPRAEVMQEDYRFKQDKITGALSLWHSEFAAQGWERPARLSECLGLERVAVWDAHHVEDRIIAAREGQSCTWLRAMEIDIARVPAHQNDLD